MSLQFTSLLDDLITQRTMINFAESVDVDIANVTVTT